MSIVNFAVAENLMLYAKPIVNPGTIVRMNSKFFSTYGSTFGKRARLLRQERGWTQIQMSEELEKNGVSAKSAWISELENADENKFPSIDVMIAYAKVFNVPTDFLLLLSDNPEKPNGSHELHWSPEVDEAGGIIDALPPDWRVEALGAVKKIRSEYEEIQRQDKEISAWLDRVEAAGGGVARAIAEQFARSYLQRLSRSGRALSVIDEVSTE